MNMAIVAIILSIIAISSGILLTIAGKPYNAFLVAIHKICSLAAAIGIGFIVKPMANNGGFSQADTILIAFSTLLFVLSLASGALLTDKGKPLPYALLAHRLLPSLTVAAIILTLVQMVG